MYNQIDVYMYISFPGFIVMKHRKADGTPCMGEREFNTSINSKCGTVRRKLKDTAAKTTLTEN